MFYIYNMVNLYLMYQEVTVKDQNLCNFIQMKCLKKDSQEECVSQQYNISENHFGVSRLLLNKK